MPEPPDSIIWLPDFLNTQPLGSAALWSCLAERLPWSTGGTEFQVEFAGAWREEATQVLRLAWDNQATYPHARGVPERTVTELGACALAVLVCAGYLEATVERLATDGDRFDYWVWWGDQWFGLEVSGTQLTSTTELQQRYREKVEQLTGNPYGLPGFVVVVSFATRTILFSAHFPEEEEDL
nr:hypothetical protein [Armatimonas sp.]